MVLKRFTVSVFCLRSGVSEFRDVDASDGRLKVLSLGLWVADLGLGW